MDANDRNCSPDLNGHTLKISPKMLLDWLNLLIVLVFGPTADHSVAHFTLDRITSFLFYGKHFYLLLRYMCIQ